MAVVSCSLAGTMVGYIRHLAVQAVLILLIIALFYRQLQLQDEVEALRDNRESRLDDQEMFDVSNVHHSTSLARSSVSDDDNLIVFYNRVPKTGSTTVMAVVYDLTKVNKFYCMHLNVTKNSHVMSLSDQMHFARNITSWKDRLPAVYHGHVFLIDFERFHIKPPILIQLIRDPIDRVVSYYYFLRYGDDFRPHLIRKKMGDKQTFDQCVARRRSGCTPADLWMQIPFFCGMAPACSVLGSRWALEQAKRNVVTKYLVVGVTEQIPQFVAVLEAVLPRFFRGAVDRFHTGGKSHLRKTKKKIAPKEETLALLKSSVEYKMEQEFYEFVLRIFEDVKERTIEERASNGRFYPKRIRYHYEKVFGPQGKIPL